MQFDRVKAGLAAFVQSVYPRIDFYAEYPGKVVAQRGSNSFDFQPDNQRFQGLSGIPIKLPFPGFSLTLDTGASPRANLGWAEGDPTKPELRLWESPGLQVLGVTAEQEIDVSAPLVKLGNGALFNHLLLGETYRMAEDQLFVALNTALTALGAFATALSSDVIDPALAAAATTLAPAVIPTTAAFAAFTGAESTYLSGISETS